eukprot:gene14651-20685_t
MAELQALKAISRAKENEEKRIAERRRNALVLILRHLADNGYVEAYERLSTEANISLNKVDVADNIDMIQIIQEFEDSYEMKFGKRPKLVKRLVEEVGAWAHAADHELPPASGALAARLRRDRGLAAEDQKKQEMLDRRQNAMNR